MNNRQHLTGDEIADYIIRTRLEMLHGLKILVLLTFLLSVALAFYENNFFLILALPLLGFIEGFRRSKVWLAKTKTEINVDEKSIMALWNFHKMKTNK